MLRVTGWTNNVSNQVRHPGYVTTHPILWPEIAACGAYLFNENLLSPAESDAHGMYLFINESSMVNDVITSGSLLHI